MASASFSLVALGLAKNTKSDQNVGLFNLTKESIPQEFRAGAGRQAGPDECFGEYHEGRKGDCKDCVSPTILMTGVKRAVLRRAGQTVLRRFTIIRGHKEHRVRRSASGRALLVSFPARR